MEKQSHIALADYIRNEGMKKQHFARMVGVGGPNLSRWLSGKVRPERPTRILIEILTKGAVKAEGWSDGV